jgi:hypothetical protein
MKFYVEDKYSLNYLYKIKKYELAAIYCSKSIWFYKNGKEHNNKNAAYIRYDGNEYFYLNGKCYGYKNKFTKQSWHKFAKLQIFL